VKKEISPAMAVGIALIAVVLIGGILYFTHRSTDGNLPTAQQAASGLKVGGKTIPGAVGGPAPTGITNAANAPGGGSAGAQ